LRETQAPLVVQYRKYVAMDCGHLKPLDAEILNAINAADPPTK
jgi:hypothetical protein